ncbi:Ankyrin repeat-containing protein, partial [Oryctes borbonicus]
GYTPLHIAAQFGHDRLYELLKDVYGANENIRDYSGRLPSHYKASQNQADAIVTKKKGRKKTTDKDLGFLRIGSLNVRVKKTTEAFSNFLGVGTAGIITPVDPSNFHKGWGSADNVAQESGIKAKRKIKRPLETSGANSTPG